MSRKLKRNRRVFGAVYENNNSEIRYNLDYLESVSYTHLDVYKRQSKDRRNNGNLVSKLRNGRLLSKVSIAR